MSEQPPVFRVRFGEYIGHAEVVSYSLLAILLFVTVLAAITSAGKTLWDNIANRTMVTGILQVLDQLLSVLMVIEILHTVRISIRSHILVTEPFLIVGLIASIRRVLVISLEASTLTKSTSWSTEGASIFRATMLRTRPTRRADPYPGFLHHSSAPLCSRPERYRKLVDHSCWAFMRRRHPKWNSRV